METCAIINIVALCILGIFTIIGLVKGFTKTFISTAGTIIAIILSAILCTTTALTLEKQFGFITFFEEKISGLMENIFGAEVLGSKIEDILSGSVSSVPFWITKIISSLVTVDSTTASQTLDSVASPLFGYYITVVVSFIILFILFKILLFLISKLLSKINKVKVFGITDKLLGGILGLIKSVIIIQILIIIIKAIPISFMQTLSLEIEKSSVCAFLTKIDLISFIINAITNPQELLNIIKGIA